MRRIEGFTRLRWPHHRLDCAVLCTGGNIPLTVATPNTLKMIAEPAAMTSIGYNTPCRPDNLLFMSRLRAFRTRKRALPPVEQPLYQGGISDESDGYIAVKPAAVSWQGDAARRARVSALITRVLPCRPRTTQALERFAGLNKAGSSSWRCSSL